MLQGVTTNLMFTDLISRVFNGRICIMSGAFQPAVMGRIFPRYSFTFSCTQAGQESGQILSGVENGGENNQRAYVRPHSSVAQTTCAFSHLAFPLS